MNHLRRVHFASVRWAVVASLALGLLVLADLALVEQSHPPCLGLAAQPQGSHLVVSWVQPGGWAFDAGVLPNDVVLAIDGQPATPDAQAVEALESAATVRTISTTGQVHDIPGAEPPVPVTDSQRLRFLLEAGLFFAIGGAVFVLSSHVGTASAVLALATSAAVMLIAPTASTSGAGWVVPSTVVSLLGLGTSTLLFFLRFPIDRLPTRAGKLAAALSLGSGGLLVGLFAWVAMFQSGEYALVQRGIILHLCGNLLSAILLLTTALLRRSPEQRVAMQAVRLVGLGTVAGLAPFAVLSLAPFAAGHGYLLPPDVTILSIVFLPASLGAALLSRQFLGVERLVRRGLVALVVWVTLVGLCGLLAQVIALPLVTVAVSAVAFSAVQRPLRRTLEAWLFHDVYDAHEVLQQMGSEIVLRTGLDSIAETVLERLGTTLDLSWASLSLDIDDRPSFSWGTPGPREEGTVVPLVTDNVEIGAMVVGPKRHDLELQEEDRSLLETLAPLVATSMRSAALTRSLEDQVVKLADREVELAALSSRLMQVQEEERRRLALDLHDDPLQRAVLLARSLGSAPETDDSARWLEWTEEIIVSLRALCQGLRPRTLDDFGLEAGLEWLLTDLGARSDLATSLDVVTDDGGPFDRLEPDLEVALYRVAQEAVNNALKHAQADTLSIELSRERDVVRLRVADDGRGLPSVESGSNRGGPSTQLGLLGMRERIAPWGGLVTAGPSPQGGTLITAAVRVRTPALPAGVGAAA